MSEKIRVVCPHCDATNAVPTDRQPLTAKCGRCHDQLFKGVPAALDGARARKHIRNSDLPLIIDFWAAWCGPCRAMAPVFEQAARTLEPKARFIKVDVDANPDIAAEHGIQGIPALLVFKNGQVVARQAGVTDLGTLRSWAERFGS
ncbi:thioredoxin TrxC [Sphingomonas sp. 179-I 2A4 NHS]|uniref:thioredoxin TrxC n=1 Tax=unclassified Sphingomonas TaxID=196159 RepID=UPI003879C220